MKLIRKIFPILAIICFSFINTDAQQVSVVINLGVLEGTEITPENVFNFQMMNNEGVSKDVVVKGSLIYRNSSLRFSYEFKTALQPGVTNFSKDKVNNAQWTFSSSAFQELFFTYAKLPQGTYEYCVEVSLDPSKVENPFIDPIDACTYFTVNDVFLINLVNPENDAKLYEYNPLLSWVVNYPFASELSYRIRVAELKEGQNNENAITRNNPVYQDNNVYATGIIYPVTARPLQVFQPYVWTVDAYFKGILLGGAEVWKFTIIEDSILKPVSVDQAYYDFVDHRGDTRLSAAGVLKLKYKSEVMHDTLSIKIYNDKGNQVKFSDGTLPVKLGDNRIDFDLYKKADLGHNKDYTLEVVTSKNSYRIPFTYINPLFLDGK